jgi:hypothetical protein
LLKFIIYVLPVGALRAVSDLKAGLQGGLVVLESFSVLHRVIRVVMLSGVVAADGALAGGFATVAGKRFCLALLFVEDGGRVTIGFGLGCDNAVL